MGKGPEQTILQRWYPNGQQIHEKMFNITNHCKSKPQRDITSHLFRWILSKSQKMTGWWGSGRKKTLVHCWWECKLVQPPREIVWRVFRKLKMEQSCHPVISLLSIYPNKKNSPSWRVIYTPVFMAVLFIVVNIWKQPECLSTDEWTKKKMWYICTQWNTIQHQKRRKSGPPWWFSGWESTCQFRGPRFDPWSGKIPYALGQLNTCAADYRGCSLGALLCNKRKPVFSIKDPVRPKII